MRQKDLIQLSITGFLVIVLIFAFGNASKKAHSRNLKDTKPKVADLAAISVNQANKSEGKSLYSMLEQQAESIELKRDPFTAAPIVSMEKSSSGVLLEGIVYDKANPMALINNQVVKIGSRVGINTVINIKQNSVILNDGTKDFELRLK